MSVPLLAPQAALDVFVTEPPPADNPLVGRDDVICTPHLGASTTEAQEDVSIEVAEVVVSALKVRSRAQRGAASGHSARSRASGTSQDVLIERIANRGARVLVHACSFRVQLRCGV